MTSHLKQYLGSEEGEHGQDDAALDEWGGRRDKDMSNRPRWLVQFILKCQKADSSLSCAVGPPRIYGGRSTRKLDSHDGSLEKWCHVVCEEA